MASSGERIENPATGTVIRFAKTARDTNGELLQMDYVLKPFARKSSRDVHVHPNQEERITMFGGTLTYILDGTDHEATADQVVSLPSPHVHALRNEHGEELHMLVEFRTALDMETFLETVAGLAREGRVNAEGNPTLLQLGVIAAAFKKEVYSANIPLNIQRVIVPMLAAMGKARGYQARYARFSGAG